MSAPSARRGPRTALRRPRTASRGTVRRSTSASASSCGPRASASASSAPWAGATGAGSGEASNSTAVMSTPETPSTSAWCVLPMSAKRGSPVRAGRESLHEVDLPQRLLAVELQREQPAGEALELLVAARRGQRAVAHVVAQVEVRVVDPDRAALLQRHEGELLAVARDEMQALVDALQQLVVRAAARPRRRARTRRACARRPARGAGSSCRARSAGRAWTWRRFWHERRVQHEASQHSTCCVSFGTPEPPPPTRGRSWTCTTPRPTPASTTITREASTAPPTGSWATPPRPRTSTQDVFLKVWRNPHKFDARRGELGSYLRLMARSRALDVWREGQAAGRASDRLKLGGGHGGASDGGPPGRDGGARKRPPRSARRAGHAARRPSARPWCSPTGAG